MNFSIKLKRNLGSIALFILFLWSWTIFGFNTYNPDYKGYEVGYYSGFSGTANSTYIGNSVEIGFKLLCSVFNVLGVPYQFFLEIISFICLGIIVKCMKDYTLSPGLAYVAYLLYPFWMNVIQIRNFIVGVILMFAIRYLMSFDKVNVLKYVFLIMLAATIHSTSIVFLALMLVYIRDCKKVMRISTMITGFLLIVRFFAFGVIGKIISMMTFLGSNFATGTGYLDYSGKYYRLMWLYFLIGGSLIAMSTYRYYADIEIEEDRTLLTMGGGKTCLD